jgi:hypothetical protein
MKFHIFLLFLLSATVTAVAQAPLTVTVKDAANNAPLPYATVRSNGKNNVTDIDGRLLLADYGTYFTVSYTGYDTQTINVKQNHNRYSVSLKVKPELLGELIITHQNPANEIIAKAIRRKVINDPQRRLESYKYKTYDRLVVTADPDSVQSRIDTIIAYEKAGHFAEKIDSAVFKFKKIVSRQHLYQTEKISEFLYNKKQGLKENVLATRMAGFKKPLYEFIGLKLQSYSVYTDGIDLFENKYAGPLARDAFFEYNFKLLDTTTINNRQVYMVYFDAKRRVKRKLRGVLYIDSETYGIAKAILRVKNVIDITSVHYFEYEKDLKLWFPEKKTLKITKGNNKEDIKFLGETIKFDAIGTEESGRKRDPSDYVYLFSEAYNFDKQYNVPVLIRRPGVEIEIKDDAINQPDAYWNRFRPDTLDTRSLTTYMALDSLVAKDNWEQRIILGRRIINGYVPLGAIDLDLRHVLKYNNYEGFRVGAGGITNNRFSNIFRISGYGAYGTKDGQFKYSGGMALRLGKFSNSWIGGSYTDDIREIGSTSFATDKRTFKIYDPRPFNITTFYNYQTWQGYIETRIIPKTESFWQLNRSRIDPKFNYIFLAGQKPYTVFDLVTASVSLQWNPFSDFMQTPDGRVESEKRFPRFAFQYTKAIAGIWGSDFNFGKFDFRAEFQHKFLNGQMTTALLQTGFAGGDVPITHLYSTSPNSLLKDGILQRITISGRNSFETMYFNEFFSSQYVTLQLKHGFTRFTVYKSLKLSPMLVTRFAWGNLSHNEAHLGFAYNTLDRGYYESGIELNEIFKGLGITGFYRYGPYQLPHFDKNVSVKLSYVLNLF